MPIPLSPEAHARLTAELEDLKIRGRVEIAKRIEEARALGDLSENGDYHAAKDEQGMMQARINQLEGMLQDAEIVEGGSSDGTAKIGSIVTIDFGGGDTDRYLIGSIEEKRDDADIVSPDAPLGQALIGQAAGATITYEAGGRSMSVTLVSVD
jgi:transcription elongation factor GreA